MFVYIWKDQAGIPFYVGLTKAIGRTNPRNSGNRNWLCKNRINEIGLNHIVIEIHTVDNIIDGQRLECQLIEKYGRIQLNNGTLTNLKDGGGGMESMSPEGRQKLSELLKNPNHPIRSPEARANHKARMQDPDIKIKFTGDNNPAKKPEVRAKIKAKWAEPEYREMQRQRKLGKPIHSDEEKEKRRQSLLNPNNPMREYHKILNTDPAIKAKRAESLRNPERCKKHSEVMKAIWAERKRIILSEHPALIEPMYYRW